ncbi:hypothetical protein ACFL7E_01260 [Thermodesulfobacteriota bacterium]
MKKVFSIIVICFAVLISVSMIIPFSSTAASQITVVGEINDDYQIVGRDGFIYEIANTVIGDELLRFMGSVVEVRGTVEEDDEGVKVITVNSFQVLGE